jgi:hypothetical protein
MREARNITIKTTNHEGKLVNEAAQLAGALSITGKLDSVGLNVLDQRTRVSRDIKIEVIMEISVLSYEKDIS